MIRAFTVVFLIAFTIGSVAVSHSAAGAESAVVEENDELIKMVIGFLGESDNEIRAIAFDQIRTTVPGTESTKAFAAELSKLSAEAQVGLLSALANRGDVAAKPAVLDLLKSNQDEAVRVAAVNALGKLGDASDCATLIGLLSTDGEISAAARQGLAQLQGEGVSAAIVDHLKAAEIPLRIVLIETLTSRRAVDAISSLLELAHGVEPATRIAAMTSLGQLAGPEHVPALVTAVLTAVKGKEREDAEKNLMFVCNRIEDKEQRAAPLLDLMKNRPQSDQTELLSALGRIGGKSALARIDEAIASRDSTIHTAGIRGLSNWPNASVAERLIGLAKTDKHADHQRIIRMTLLRIAPLPDGRTDVEKLALLKSGMKLAANDNERNYGLKRAAPIRIVETLRFVLPYVDQPKCANEACQTVVELAHDRKLRDDNKPEFHAALDKVIATTQDAEIVDRANRYKQGQTWVRPK